MGNIIKFPGNEKDPIDSERLRMLHEEFIAASQHCNQSYKRAIELHFSFQQALVAIVFFHGVGGIPDRYLEFFYPENSVFQIDFEDIYDW